MWLRARLDRPARSLHRFAFDPTQLARSRGYSAQLRDASTPLLVRRGRGALTWLDRWRARIERSILTRSGHPESGVMLALATGSRSVLDPDVRSRFRRNGAAHVLAVSGLHLGLFCLGFNALVERSLRGFTWLTRRIASRACAALITLPVVAGYVLLSGASASAVRAGCMAAVFLLGVTMGRKASAVHALAVAALGILSHRPAWCFDLGFQLSIVATLALILASRTRRATLGRASWALESLRMSVVAALATSPVLLWLFGELPVASPITNLLVVPPLAFVALPCSLFGAMLDVAGVPGAELLLWFSARVVRLTLWITEAAGSWLETTLCWGRPRGVAIGGWLVVALSSPWVGVASLRAHACTLALAGALLASAPPLGWFAPERMELHVIPVGQGDSTLVRLPDGTSILIDGGGVVTGTRSVGLTRVLPYLRGLGIGRVSILVATHGDYDHAEGVSALLVPLGAQEVWLPGGDRSTSLRHIEARAEAAGVVVRRVWTDQIRLFGQVEVQLLPAPRAPHPNDQSLVMRLCLEGVCALWTGDIEAAREVELLRSGVSLRADVLKLAHHGSRTSSSCSFLDAVRPRVAVAMVGAENRFGFPHPEILDRLGARGVRVLRSDEGEHVVELGGEGVRIYRPGRDPPFGGRAGGGI